LKKFSNIKAYDQLTSCREGNVIGCSYESAVLVLVTSIHLKKRENTEFATAFGRKVLPFDL